MYIILAVFVFVFLPEGHAQVSEKHNLRFNHLAKSWDEGIPLGNGLLGALIWQQGDRLRMSLDRADLWDLRKIKEFDRPEFKFSWVADQVKKNDYKPVQDLFDVPYDRDPAPSKIPAGAIEFDITRFGGIDSVELHLADALCKVRWKSGVVFTTFVHATEPVGWFRFEKLPDDKFSPQLVPPPYAKANDSTAKTQNVVAGADLQRLDYPNPVVSHGYHFASYNQEGYGGFRFWAILKWQYLDAHTMEGMWNITSAYPESTTANTDKIIRKALSNGFRKELASHKLWWLKYWNQSSIRLPDPILEKQWYLEQYKFGSASRRGAPPITLQAVWTADNGKLPPWKGDYHNDLNTQLSYWPCYSGNHLEEGLAFTDWLWKNKQEAESYTKTYFGTDGLNYPGVSTLTGQPMGGWIQYALSPTTSAWLAQNFYLHWRYSMDRDFLKQRAYPWIREVAIHLDQLSKKGKDGKRKLPLSSSPEFHDNDIKAWFPQTTNYDLALIRWLYGKAAELANEVGNTDEAAKWENILTEWPQLATSEKDSSLLLAPGIPVAESHRHFSHLMGIHPLGLIDWDNGKKDQRIIKASLANLIKNGTDWWCGYSYAWLGNLAARARYGATAADALKIFAQCFCLANSFHVNGDQSRSGKSKYTYRPFTLEGNFAFASGIQEMLMQSQTNVVRIFPAVPPTWQNIAFDNLRAEGAFLVSAKMEMGTVTHVRIFSEQGGLLHFANPFGVRKYAVSGSSRNALKENNGIIEVDTQKGGEIMLDLE
jgi:alpha-L-fucosidase 2